MKRTIKPAAGRSRITPEEATRAAVGPFTPRTGTRIRRKPHGRWCEIVRVVAVGGRVWAKVKDGPHWTGWIKGESLRAHWTTE